MRVMLRGFLFLFCILYSLSAYGYEDLPEGFVYLRDIAPDIQQDIRYATRYNFTGNPVPGYEAGECILKEDAAKALKKVQTYVLGANFSLKVYDCYRPRQAVRAFGEWARNGEETKYTKLYYPFYDKRNLFELGFIASRSEHSVGVAVDLTLVPIPSPFVTSTSEDQYKPCHRSVHEREPDNSVDMGTAFDCFHEHSHTWHEAITEDQRKNREFLVNAMRLQGFKNYSKEWWHFSYPVEGRKRYYNFPVTKR